MLNLFFRKCIVTVCLVIMSFTVFGQKHKASDSLSLLLKTAGNDTTYSNILSQLIDNTDGDEKKSFVAKQISFIENKLKSEKDNFFIKFYKKHLANAYFNRGALLMTDLKTQDAIKALELSITLSESIKDSGSYTNAYLYIGNILRKQGNVPKALSYFKKSLLVEEKSKNYDVMVITLSELAYTYEELGDETNSLFYYKKLREVAITNHDTFAIAYSYRRAGLIERKKGNYEKALQYFQESITLYDNIKQKGLVAIALEDIAFLYHEKKDYAKALETMNKSLVMREKIGNKHSIADCLHNIATIYFDKKDYDKAIDYFSESLETQPDSSNVEGIINTNNSLAETYYSLKNYHKAEQYGLISLRLSKKLGYPESLKNTTELLTKIYKAQNNTKGALEMYEIFIQMRDSLNNDELKKMSMKTQFENEYAQQAIADSLKMGEERKVNHLKFEKEKTQRIALYAGLALFVLFSGFLYNRFKVSQKQSRLIEKQKHIVEEKHKEITDSINYAERIQRSFLADFHLLDTHLQEYFVFFKPKDVVSGDFFWAASLPNGNFALAVADSTGHGVPGAIMSLLNVTSIEAAVKDGYHEPAAILNHTRQTIIERLKKDGSPEGGKDGMDVSLICFDFKTSVLTYAAANNPIWVVRQNTLTELKGDKMPVGKHDKDQTPFTEHSYSLMKDDTIYCLTDGFPDQFGGLKGKKYMYKQLKETLLAISGQPLAKQKETLQDVLNDWMGSAEQVDDITIIGIKI